jgi:hypothetical protein
MSIPEEVWNGAWHGNWQDDEETIHGILEKPPVDARHRRPNGRASEIRSPLQSEVLLA